MRPLPAFLGVAVLALILVSCSGDQGAVTAPSTAPLFTKTSPSPIDPGDQYEFSIGCNKAAAQNSGTTELDITLSDGTFFELFCNSTPVTYGAGLATSFNSFSYSFALYSDPDPLPASCSGSQVNTTGTFTCKSKKWEATLTVTDLGPPIHP